MDHAIRLRPAAVARAWLAWTQRPLPNRWIKGGLLMVAVALTIISHKTIVGRDAGVTLIIMLLVLKTLSCAPGAMRW